MEQCYTPRQRQFIDLAATLADEFATRAAEHDRDGTFPFENYERMKQTGYLGLSVPVELGGMGASLLEMCLAQERLAIAVAECGAIQEGERKIWREFRHPSRSRRPMWSEDRSRPLGRRRPGHRSGRVSDRT